MIPKQQYNFKMPHKNQLASPFSESDKDYLRNCYLVKSDLDMSLELNRTITSVRLKRQRMFLNRWKMNCHTNKRIKVVPIEEATDKENEVHALEYFMSTTSSSLLRDIAKERWSELQMIIERETVKP